MIATLVGASVGVPYFVSQAPQQQSAPAPATPVSTNAGPAAGRVTPLLALPSGVAPAGTPSAAPRLDGAQFTSVAQVLRFDVTKEWVYRNWSRKTTAPTDVGLVSVRVPLVMGTQMSALAGSLTYFFNAEGQVEHISFRGRTGDTRPLVQLLTQYYQFQHVEAPIGEKLYQVQSGDGVQSELRLQPEGVIRSNAPQQSIAVELELARPGSPRVLPPRGPGLQIPPVAESTPLPPSSTTGSISSSIKSAASNYWDQIRYATPAEENPGLSKRWPD
jgi:hypothetical protein